MKTLLSVSIVAAVILGSGCAPVQYTKADIDGRYVCDADRMAQVERAAQRAGAEVHWVKCPQVRLRVAS